MEVKKIVNKYRRSILHFLTKDIGNTGLIHTAAIGSAAEIKKVLICRPNHRLGNLLLITPLVQDVERIFPNCSIDLFIKGDLGDSLFENYHSIDKIIALPKKAFSNPIDYVKGWVSLRKRSYDLVVNVAADSSSGRLSAKISRSRFKFFGDAANSMMDVHYDDLGHIAKGPVYNLRYFLWGHNSFFPSLPVADLNLKLSLLESFDGKKLLRELTGQEQKIITLFTYGTGDKCYSRDWWEKFYKGLQQRFPDYIILEILPAEFVSQIDFEAYNFYSWNVREIGAVLANVDIFIGADSGIMHLAHAAGAPVVGLFSVTSLSKYEPYNTASIAVDTNKSNMETLFNVVNEILDIGREKHY